MSGFVYFIRCHDRVKIGYSADPRARLVKINADAPYPCKLLGYVEADDFPERDIHERFAGLRVHGEWFLASAALLSFVETISTKVVATDRFEAIDLTDANPIKAWRVRSKIRQEDAARLVGIHKVHWNRWENNKRPVSVPKVLAVEKLTGISRHILRPDVHGPPPPVAA